MKVEILLSCLNGNIEKILQNINLQCNILIINQCDENSFEEFIYNNFKVRVINTTTRGLAVSRNIALTNSMGDLLLICDDDVSYKDGLVHIVQSSFKRIDKADIAIFDIERINHVGKDPKPIRKIKQSKRFRTYGSVRIALKASSIKEKNIRFDEQFGTGSLFVSGEDSIFLRDAQKKGLKVYLFPNTIAEVDFSISTWRNTEKEKILQDKGALLARAYPSFLFPFLLYMTYATRGYGLNYFKRYYYIKKGIKEYKRISK